MVRKWIEIRCSAVRIMVRYVLVQSQHFNLRIILCSLSHSAKCSNVTQWMRCVSVYHMCLGGSEPLWGHKKRFDFVCAAESLEYALVACTNDASSSTMIILILRRENSLDKMWITKWNWAVLRSLSLGVKCPGRAADHSPPSTAEVKNACSYTSAPQYAFIAWCAVTKKAQGQLYRDHTNINHMIVWKLISINYSWLE
jgi:hypothetical protein